MSGLMDFDDFSDLRRRGREVIANHAVLVESAYGGIFMIPRSDLTTLLDISARAVRVARPEGVPESWKQPYEPTPEPGAGLVDRVSIGKVVVTGTAKAAAEHDAAVEAEAMAPSTCPPRTADAAE